MTIQANAKVNLVLRILGKRADGYHEIETLMVPVTLADELEVVVAAGTGITIACDDPSVPADASNLAWRAAEAFAGESGLTFRTSIILRKRIPHGAGLGGGSSDAAATLKALDALLETNLGDKALEKIAATIGSDVPFFIQNKPSWCRGRGELLEAAGQQPPTKLLLIKPPFPVSTAWAYRAAGAERRPCESQRRARTNPSDAAHLSNHLADRAIGFPHQITADMPRSAADSAGQSVEQPEPPPCDLSGLGGIEICNDFESPVFQKFLLLPAIKSWLIKQPEVEAAMMSGSGSTLFAVLRGNALDLDRPGLAARATERFGRSLWVSECSTLSS